jgi:S-adenosylmethionine uptake transporter
MENADNSHFKTVVQAIGLGLLSWTLFAFGDAGMKWLTSDYHVAWVQVAYSFFGVILTLLYHFMFYRGKSFKSGFWRLHSLRGLTIAGTAICVINGISQLPLAEFYCIMFLTPMVTCLMAAVFLKETITSHHIISAILGFIGVTIVSGPEVSNMNSGVFYLLAAVIFLSINSIIIRKIDNDEPTSVYNLYAFGATLIANIIIIVFTCLKSGAALETLDSIIQVAPSFSVALLVGFFFFIAMILSIHAFSIVPSTSIIAPFHYSQLIFGVILGYVIFRDIPPDTTWAGGSLIIFAGLYLIYQEHRQSKKTACLSA